MHILDLTPRALTGDRQQRPWRKFHLQSTARLGMDITYRNLLMMLINLCNSMTGRLTLMSTLRNFQVLESTTTLKCPLNLQVLYL